MKVYEKVLQAYQWATDLRIPHGEIIADVTAGTKAISIGMDLACRKLNLSMECIVSDFDNGKRIPGSERFVAIDPAFPGDPAGAATASTTDVANTISGNVTADVAKTPAATDGADGAVPIGDGVASGGDGDGNSDATASR